MAKPNPFAKAPKSAPTKSGKPAEKKLPPWMMKPKAKGKKC